MIALLSDIHGNLEALQAVLADAQSQGASRIYCLGDMVGYGANPRECVDLAMEWAVVLMGNHEQAVLSEQAKLGDTTGRSTLWTRAQLKAPIPDPLAAQRRLDFLAGLPQTHKEGDLLFVHGSARKPLTEYVFPEDIYFPPKMEAIFAQVDRYCFQGHTHLPGVFIEPLEFFEPFAINQAHRLDGRKSLVNVGSVGQPRDGTWRSCYVLLDGDQVLFRRVSYDVDTTIAKLKTIPELADEEE